MRAGSHLSSTRRATDGIIDVASGFPLWPDSRSNLEVRHKRKLMGEGKGVVSIPSRIVLNKISIADTHTM